MKCPFVLLILVVSSDAFAGLITIPVSLAPGDQYRLAFVTNAKLQPSGNIVDYDTFVTQQANQVPALADLNIAWRAIASTLTIDARDNTGTNPNVSIGYPIYRTDGTLIANNNIDLWDGTLVNPLSLTQNAVPPDDYGVWPGSASNGVRIDGLTLDGDGLAKIGITLFPTEQWMAYDQYNQSISQLRFYALSDIITVPVPEPCTILLIGGSFLVLLHTIRRRTC